MFSWLKLKLHITPKSKEELDLIKRDITITKQRKQIKEYRSKQKTKCKAATKIANKN